MNKTMDNRSSFINGLFEGRNKAVTLNERKRVALIVYENYICQYKALLLQCEQEFEILIYSESNMANLPLSLCLEVALQSSSKSCGNPLLLKGIELC